MMDIYCLYHKNIISEHILVFVAVWEKTPGSITTRRIGMIKVRASKMAQEYKPGDQNLRKKSQT